MNNAHYKALLALPDAQLVESAGLTDAEFDELENQLALRAGCMGWTGDPCASRSNLWPRLCAVSSPGAHRALIVTSPKGGVTLGANVRCAHFAGS